METYILIKTGLVLHLAGITLMAGITVASMVVYQQSLKLLPDKKNNISLIIKATAIYPILQFVGAILIIAGGVIMGIGYHGAVMHMLWFKIKLGLIALIILNQLFVGRPAGISLRKLLSVHPDERAVSQTTIINIKKGILSFYRIQLALFLMIFILSSFRFS